MTSRIIILLLLTLVSCTTIKHAVDRFLDKVSPDDNKVEHTYKETTKK